MTTSRIGEYGRSVEKQTISYMYPPVQVGERRALRYALSRMAWGMELRRTCRVCKRQREHDEIFSARGKCPACGRDRVIDNATQLHLHSGPYFERWREAVARSVGAVIQDGRAA